MSQPRNYALLAYVLLGKPRTRLERILFNVVVASGLCIPLSYIPFVFVGYGSADGLHYTIAQRLAYGFAATSSVVFLLSLPVAAMVVLGRKAGYKNPITQMAFVLSRVFLFLLLPCLLITFTVMLVAWMATGVPPWVASY